MIFYGVKITTKVSDQWYDLEFKSQYEIYLKSGLQYVMRTLLSF